MYERRTGKNENKIGKFQKRVEKGGMHWEKIHVEKKKRENS